LKTNQAPEKQSATHPGVRAFRGVTATVTSGKRDKKELSRKIPVVKRIAERGIDKPKSSTRPGVCETGRWNSENADKEKKDLTFALKPLRISRGLTKRGHGPLSN